MTQFATRDHEGRTVRSFATDPSESYLAMLETTYDATVSYGPWDNYGQPVHVIKCWSCSRTHATVTEVKGCHAEAQASFDEWQAEMAAEEASEIAFARSREAISEQGTWFGPDTEADRW